MFRAGSCRTAPTGSAGEHVRHGGAHLRGDPLPQRPAADAVHPRSDMLARHGADSAQARVHHVRGPYLLAVAERVETRLASAGQVGVGPATTGRLAQI